MARARSDTAAVNLQAGKAVNSTASSALKADAQKARASTADALTRLDLVKQDVTSVGIAQAQTDLTAAGLDLGTAAQALATAQRSTG